MKKIIIAIIIILALGFGWYLISPLFIDKEINEDFPQGINTENKEVEIKETPVVKNIEDYNEPDKKVIEPMPEMPAEPQKVLAGDFKDADDFHMSSGSASIYDIDGKNVLRLEDFTVTNGPQLVVILSEIPEPKNKEDLYSGEYIELADLKGNIGNQNYDIPEGYTLEKVKSVVIYCKPFHVVFGTADLN